MAHLYLRDFSVNEFDMVTHGEKQDRYLSNWDSELDVYIYTIPCLKRCAGLVSFILN